MRVGWKRRRIDKVSRYGSPNCQEIYLLPFIVRDAFLIRFRQLQKSRPFHCGILIFYEAMRKVLGYCRIGPRFLIWTVYNAPVSNNASEKAVNCQRSEMILHALLPV